MDKRRKHIDHDAERALREKFYHDIESGSLSLAESVKMMRKIARLTQVEFARHRGISLPTLKQIESGTGSTKVETLNRIADIFGLEIGFVKKPSVPRD